MNFVDREHDNDTLSEKEKSILECRKFYEQFDKKKVSKIKTTKSNLI